MRAASLSGVPHVFSPVSPPVSLQRSRATGGFSLVQALVAMTIVMIAGFASVQALVWTNRKAASMRTINNARAIVQRNIDVALGVPFDSNNPVPAILALTSTAGNIFNGDIDSAVPVLLVAKRDGTPAAQGVLRRTVTAQSTNPDIRRVVFNLGWPYRSGSLTATLPNNLSMTTLRTTDD
jgi:type II secretory pathway pseudopilin PulG